MRLQQQIDCELKRRQQLEDALKASGGPAEALRLISGKFINLKKKIIFYKYNCFTKAKRNDLINSIICVLRLAFKLPDGVALLFLLKI